MQPEERDAPTPYDLIGGDAKGGPPLYMDQYGHPTLRARHMPFAMGTLERDQWMACMVQAMEETDLPQELRRALEAAFFKTADWMRNRPC